MNKKILVADDSLTIQKVISITLANSSYDLDECLSEEDLFLKLESNDYDLILLDYNLSKALNGLQLSVEVVKHAPTVPIMAMMGTFDNVENDILRECGVRDKIIKPFDGTDFISKCSKLVANDSESEDFDLDDVQVENEGLSTENSDLSDEAISDEWIMESSAEVETSSNAESSLLEETLTVEDKTENYLESEIESWGFAVPDKIGDEKFETHDHTHHIPIIDGIVTGEFSTEESLTTDLNIDTENSLNEDHTVEIELDENFNVDLNAIKENSFTQGLETEIEVVEELSADSGLDDPHIDETESEVNIFSKFTSLDDLNVENVDDHSEDETETETEIESRLVLTRDIGKEIEDDIDAEEFWAVDQKNDRFDKTVNDEKNLSSGNLQQVNLQKDINLGINEDAIADLVIIKLRPLLDDMIREFCASKVEEVSWEVIPDLAENLIKKEISDIAQDLKNI